jgi:hypothetical protein
MLCMRVQPADNSPCFVVPIQRSTDRAILSSLAPAGDPTGPGQGLHSSKQIQDRHRASIVQSCIRQRHCGAISALQLMRGHGGACSPHHVTLYGHVVVTAAATASETRAAATLFWPQRKNSPHLAGCVCPCQDTWQASATLATLAKRLTVSMHAQARVSADPHRCHNGVAHENGFATHASLQASKSSAAHHTHLSSNASPATSLGCAAAYCSAIWPPALCPTRMKGPGARSGTAANRFFRASVLCRSSKLSM